jgi:AraC-like DNA-binding protein
VRFSSCRPSGVLSHCVENFWLYEGYEGEHANERILPTGTIELVINLREDELRIYDADEPERCSRYSGAVVSGAYRKGFVSDSEEEAFLIGVHFRPGGAFPFLDLPVDEIADTHLDLELLWGYSAKLLREQLCGATTAQARFELLESALTAHISRPFEHHYAVASALEAFGKRVDVGVRDVAKETGLSHRRFSQLFKREVGMTPKLFSRVQRFQRTRSTIHRHDAGAVDWADAAVECGYSDQSHMIRDFSEFSGMSPEAYLRQYRSFLAQQTHIKRYHFPLSSKAGQFYPIQQVSHDDILNLGGSYVSK